MTQEPAINIHDVDKSTTVIHRQDPTLTVSGDSMRLKRIVEKAGVSKSELSGLIDGYYCPRSSIRDANVQVVVLTYVFATVIGRIERFSLSSN